LKRVEPISEPVRIVPWTLPLELAGCSASWFTPDDRRAWTVVLDPVALTSGCRQWFGVPCGCDKPHLGGVFVVDLHILPVEMRTGGLTHRLVVTTAGNSTIGIKALGRAQLWRSASDEKTERWAKSLADGTLSSTRSYASLPQKLKVSIVVQNFG
jgi:hypothetical protein